MRIYQVYNIGSAAPGNYFGMMQPAIELRQRGGVYFIANLHSLYRRFSTAMKGAGTRWMCAGFFGVWVDSQRSSFFFGIGCFQKLQDVDVMLSSLTADGLLSAPQATKIRSPKAFAE